MKTPITIYFLAVFAIIYLVVPGIELYKDTMTLYEFMINELLLPISILLLILGYKLFYWITLVLFTLEVATFSGPIIIAASLNNINEHSLPYIGIVIFQLILFIMLINSNVLRWLNKRSNKKFNMDSGADAPPPVN